MTLLAKVEDSFSLPSVMRAYGCVIVFKLLIGRIRVEDPIQLRTPDGQVRDTYVAAFVHLKPREKDRIFICLPTGIGKEDVPAGTEIWSLKD